MSTANTGPSHERGFQESDKCSFQSFSVIPVIFLSQMKAYLNGISTHCKAQAPVSKSPVPVWSPTLEFASHTPSDKASPCSPCIRAKTAPNPASTRTQGHIVRRHFHFNSAVLHPEPVPLGLRCICSKTKAGTAGSADGRCDGHAPALARPVTGV